MRLSSLLATLCFVGAFPVSLAIAYLGFRAAYYPYAAVPFVGVGILLAIVGTLVVVLSRLREGQRLRHE